MGRIYADIGSFNVTQIPWEAGPSIFFYNKKNNLEYFYPDEYKEINSKDKFINTKFKILCNPTEIRKGTYHANLLTIIKELTELNEDINILVTNKNFYILEPGHKFFKPNDNLIKQHISQLEVIRKKHQEYEFIRKDS